MNNPGQQPLLIFLDENQAQADPVHPAVLWVETGEVKFDETSPRVELGDVLEETEGFRDLPESVDRASEVKDNHAN